MFGHGQGHTRVCRGIEEDSEISMCLPAYGCKCINSYNNTWSCERKLNMDENSISCRFDDDEKFIETYDLNEDPYQLNNIHVESMEE